MFDAAGKLVSRLEGPGGSVECLLWHPSGKAILACSSDSTAWLWAIPSGTSKVHGEGCRGRALNFWRFSQCFSGHAGSVTCAAFTADG